MLPDTYSTANLNCIWTRNHLERHHGLWRRLRDGQRPAVERSLVILPERILLDWPATARSIAPSILRRSQDWTGKSFCSAPGPGCAFPAEVFSPDALRSRRGSHGHAGRLPHYNILLAEDRRVAAVLLIG